MPGMKKLYYLILILGVTITAQEIGKLAPDEGPEAFPPNAWGVDLMFGEGGFGLGTFLRNDFSTTVTGFVDLSFSESKDDREFQYIDIFGNTYTVGKKNRVFLVPLNFGLQYRLFEDELTSTLRPYLNIGVGPTMVVSTPYNQEFFNSFGDAKAKFAAGGYVGLGGNFGTSKTNLVGINLRYYYIHLFDEGVENLIGRFRQDISHFYLTINIGIMY